jgi:hypothetical protein
MIGELCFFGYHGFRSGIETNHAYNHLYTFDSAGEIGFKANVQFIRGTPPYAFHYRFYRKGHTPSTFVKSAIYKTTEEIAIKPDQPGTYVFVSKVLCSKVCGALTSCPLPCTLGAVWHS